MEVTRAREKEQGGRELRRSLKAATVVLYSGGMDGVWVAAGRGRREKRREERLVHGRKCGRMVRAVEVVAARAWQKVRPHGASGGSGSEM